MSRRQRKKQSPPPGAEPTADRSAESAGQSLAEAVQEALEVSPEKAERLGARLEGVLAVTVRQSLSGPLPPPHILDEYERLSPGLLNRIVGMAERQADHRQELEQVVVRGNTWMGKAGVIGGSVLGLAALAVIALAIIYEAPLQYLGGILVAAASLSGVFLWARKKKVQDANERLERVRELVTESTTPRLPKRIKRQ